MKLLLPQKMKKQIKNVYEKVLFLKIVLFVLYVKQHGSIKGQKGAKNIYLVGSTSHNNIGDHAISYAEILFLKQYFKDYTVIECLDKDVCKCYWEIKREIGADDLIFLHGGGNFGVEYIFHERVRRLFISTFVHNKIIIFPQTFDFGNSKKGRKELSKSIKIYSKHPRLLIILREKYSFDSVKKLFCKNQAMLTPDIVLSLKLGDRHLHRSGVLLCIRNDAERVTPHTFEAEVIEKLEHEAIPYKRSGTIYAEDFGLEQRERVLEEKWREFSMAQLIITDRLHAMVFCALLNVKCIVLPNYNNKVLGTYEWIQENPNIIFLRNAEDINKYICKQYLEKPVLKSGRDFSVYYAGICECIEKL